LDASDLAAWETGLVSDLMSARVKATAYLVVLIEVAYGQSSTFGQTKYGQIIRQSVGLSFVQVSGLLDDGGERKNLLQHIGE
jgi:hypothetical protein